MGTNLFDESAAEFAQVIDRQIQMGRYVRGEVFAEAVNEAVVRGGAILDYGCGPGRLSLRLARDGYEIIGVDSSPEMIAQARAIPAMDFRITFSLIAQDALLATAQYDAIICSSVIEYVRDPQALLRRFRQALKPSGRLVISYANRRSVFRMYANVRFRHAAFRSYQHNLWTLNEFRRVLRKSGFIVTFPVRIFESPFDSHRIFRCLSSLPWVGTLGLVVAEPVVSNGADVT